MGILLDARCITKQIKILRPWFYSIIIFKWPHCPMGAERSRIDFDILSIWLLRCKEMEEGFILT